MKSTLICLFATLTIAAGTIASPVHRNQPAPAEPPYIVTEELNPKLDGKEVTMSFAIRETYMISGSVPIGQFPSFGISPVLKKGSPRFGVLVGGDLANLMDRFGALDPSPNDFKGRWMQATGKITVFPALKNEAHVSFRVRNTIACNIATVSSLRLCVHSNTAT